MAPVDMALMESGESDQSTQTRVRVSRVAPAVLTILALVVAAFSLGRWSKAVVADPRSSTVLTATEVTAAPVPANIVAGVATAITITWANAILATDTMGWAPTGQCASATLVPVGAAAAAGATTTTTFTLPCAHGPLKLCVKLAADAAPIEQTNANAALTATMVGMPHPAWGACYSAATAGKTAEVIKSIDNMIRGAVAPTTTDTTILGLNAFYNSAACGPGTPCRLTSDHAVSHMLSGTAGR